MKQGMTVEEAEFAGAILTAMVTEGQAITNRIEENLRYELAEAEKKFVKLFRAIDGANKSVDSVRIERILDGYEYDYIRMAEKNVEVLK